MKQTIFLLLALVLLLSLCACAEKKPETTESNEPTEIHLTIGPEDPGLSPNDDKVPIEDTLTTGRETKPTDGRDIEAETLPPMSWGDIPEPEPVEPDTEVADS